jgi:hypothetical protein
MPHSKGVYPRLESPGLPVKNDGEPIRTCSTLWEGDDWESVLETLKSRCEVRIRILPLPFLPLEIYSRVLLISMRKEVIRAMERIAEAPGGADPH